MVRTPGGVSSSIVFSAIAAPAGEKRRVHENVKPGICWIAGAEICTMTPIIVKRTGSSGSMGPTCDARAEVRLARSGSPGYADGVSLTAIGSKGGSVYARARIEDSSLELAAALMPMVDDRMVAPSAVS